MQTLRRAVACVLIATAFLPQSAARAHAILLDSRPAVGTTVTAGPMNFRLRYNSRIDVVRSRLILTRPDGSTVVLASAPGPTPDLLLAHARLSPGAYSIRWLVLATDGHITRGDVPFTVRAP